MRSGDTRRSTHANGEFIVSNYLTARGFSVQRFSKAEMRRSRTPDFRVLSGDRLAFYCEVKTAQEDDWLQRQLDAVPPGTLVGGSRPDPTYNRISDYVHSAASQFDDVNPRCEHPNVLAIVNNDSDAGFHDLLAVLTGNAYTNSGPIRIFGRFSDGRVRLARHRIHLYLWFDVGKSRPSMFWIQSHPEHHAALCRFLGVNPARIGPLPG